MPALLSGFVSDDKPMTAREQSALKDDVTIERRFYMKPERAILATVVLSGAEKRSLHPPEICLGAGGWVFNHQSIVPLELGGGQEARVSLISMHRDEESTTEPGKRVRTSGINLFWYQGSDGTICASYEEHVIRTYLDAVFRNVNHRWALMSFFAPLKPQAPGVTDPFEELAATEETKAFIRDLIPHLQP